MAGTTHALKVSVFLPGRYSRMDLAHKYNKVMQNCPCCGSKLVLLMEKFGELNSQSLLGSRDHVMTGGWYCSQCGLHVMPGEDVQLFRAVEHMLPRGDAVRDKRSRGDSNMTALSKLDDVTMDTPDPYKGHSNIGSRMDQSQDPQHKADAMIADYSPPRGIIEEEDYQLWESRLQSEFSDFLRHMRDRFKAKETLYQQCQVDLCQREKALQNGEVSFQQKMDKVKAAEKDIFAKLQKLADYKQNLLKQAQDQIKDWKSPTKHRQQLADKAVQADNVGFENMKDSIESGYSSGYANSPDKFVFGERIRMGLGGLRQAENVRIGSRLCDEVLQTSPTKSPAKPARSMGNIPTLNTGPTRGIHGSSPNRQQSHTNADPDAQLRSRKDLTKLFNDPNEGNQVWHNPKTAEKKSSPSRPSHGLSISGGSGPRFLSPPPRKSNYSPTRRTTSADRHPVPDAGYAYSYSASTLLSAARSCEDLLESTLERARKRQNQNKQNAITASAGATRSPNPQAKDYTLSPAKDYTQSPAKDYALSPAKDYTLSPAKDYALSPAKDYGLVQSQDQNRSMLSPASYRTEHKLTLTQSGNHYDGAARDKQHAEDSRREWEEHRKRLDDSRRHLEDRRSKSASSIKPNRARESSPSRPVMQRAASIDLLDKEQPQDRHVTTRHHASSPPRQPHPHQPRMGGHKHHNISHTEDRHRRDFQTPTRTTDHPVRSIMFQKDRDGSANKSLPFDEEPPPVYQKKAHPPKQDAHHVQPHPSVTARGHSVHPYDVRSPNEASQQTPKDQKDTSKPIRQQGTYPEKERTHGYHVDNHVTSSPGHRNLIRHVETRSSGKNKTAGYQADNHMTSSPDHRELIRHVESRSSGKKVSTNTNTNAIANGHIRNIDRTSTAIGVQRAYPADRSPYRHQSDHQKQSHSPARLLESVSGSPFKIRTSASEKQKQPDHVQHGNQRPADMGRQENSSNNNNVKSSGFGTEYIDDLDTVDFAIDEQYPSPNPWVKAPAKPKRNFTEHKQNCGDSDRVDCLGSVLDKPRTKDHGPPPQVKPKPNWLGLRRLAGKDHPGGSTADNQHHLSLNQIKHHSAYKSPDHV